MTSFALADGRTFYVDSAAGDDQRDGLTEATAWRSLQRVNEAEIQPGDVVRFKRGGTWRGSLQPASGTADAPVTYTSYGQGDKPALLGSRPRNHADDWVKIADYIWATQPLIFTRRDKLIDLSSSSWRYHYEAGAKIAFEQNDGRVTVRCINSGEASHHIQLWGPTIPVERGGKYIMTLRARSSKPFKPTRMAIQRPQSPWNNFAPGRDIEGVIGPEWRDLEIAFEADMTSDIGQIHIMLGGAIPEGAVFEFEPQAIHAATVNLPDPLNVDVGNIIFDHGETCGWKRWSIDELKNPGDYFYDPASWRVYLYADANPATQHQSIELALKRHVVNHTKAHHVIFDGLAVRYGAAHGFGGGESQNLIIRHCDISYIGGGVLNYRNGRPVRYGNGIEFWGGAENNLVEHCRLWQIYDAALTNQNKGQVKTQRNITYRDNLILNSEYSFEYWNNPAESVTENVVFENNTCLFAGDVWAHAQRPDRNGSHVMLYTNQARSNRIIIRNNIFYQWTEWGCRTSAGWQTLPEMDHNLWFSSQGVMAYWFRDKLADFGKYQQITGLGAHSRFAEPEFTDAASGDWTLAADSPGQSLGEDGGPIGARRGGFE
ncbi:right-handed parallel beta-helix repeat-containing protein [Planctomycetales bacterium ZRK34]|nr:right-handed parallel beta-helix repeat-containing protein [Planctomycetales bacterium ZRK34]